MAKVASVILLALCAGYGSGETDAQEMTARHFAGTTGGIGFFDGAGSEARFAHPHGIALDHNGNLLVADYINHTIRRVTPEGVVTTLAGLAGMSGSDDGLGFEARFQFIKGMAVDGNGNIYVSDQNNLIRKITPAGVVTTLAGVAGVFGSDDGTGSEATFRSPTYLAVDDAGNVWVPDYSNHTIRRITPDGVVTTVAGLAGTPGSDDGTGSEARFRNPSAIAIDANGNLFVSDTYNHTIRKMSPAGVVTTFAGEAGTSGSTDASGSAARFNRPRGLAVGSDGTIYVADTSNHVVKVITPGGLVSTLAGSAGERGAVDGQGDVARFEGPEAVIVDESGNVYVTDRYNDAIRKITPDGQVSTLAGRPSIPGDADGSGASARFSATRSVAVDGSGNVFVADSFNHLIRRITPAGDVSTFAGESGVSGSEDGTGSAARFSTPRGVAVDAAGNVYVADFSNHAVRRISPTGAVSTLAGTAGMMGSADGIGPAARFSGPAAVAVDGDLNVYVADMLNHTIRKISPVGVVTTIAGLAGSSGSADGTGAEARFNRPEGLAVDDSGSVFVADTVNNLIREIAPDGNVSTLAGQAGVGGPFSDGIGSEATFNRPRGVAVDGNGNVLVADTLTYTIRHVTPGGLVTTIAGSPVRPGHVDGTGVAARFDDPSDIAVDATGTVYVADSLNYAVRKLAVAPPDRAAIDAAVGAVGMPRQLDVEPQTMTSWSWQIIRRPAGSSAELSSTSIRNPTFTPDLADLYVFRVTASNGPQVAISEVSLSATALEVATPTGTGVTIGADKGTVTFDTVTSGGVTTFTPISVEAVMDLPDGHTAAAAFDISTTAGFTAPVDVCFTMADVSDSLEFSKLRVFHEEEGDLVDRTHSRDFESRTVCARVSSFSVFVVARAPFVRGDANGDDQIAVADVFYLINHLFAAGPLPVGDGDANGDGSVGVADVFYLINHLFAAGPAPLSTRAGVAASPPACTSTPRFELGTPAIARDGIVRVPVYVREFARPDAIAFRVTAEPTRAIREIAIRRLAGSETGKGPFEAAPASGGSAGYVAVFDVSTWSGVAHDRPVAMIDVEYDETPRYGPVTIHFDGALSALYRGDEGCTGDQVGVDSVALPTHLARPRISVDGSLRP